MSTDLSDCPTNDIFCYGQTQEHAIAIALEQSANHHRQIAEEQQKRTTVPTFICCFIKVA
jgi:hypothetical protein